MKYVVVSHSPVFRIFFSQFVNFLAKVSQPNMVEVQEMVSAGNNLDVGQYNQTVELMHSAKFSHLFL